MNEVELGFSALANRDYQEAVNIFRSALDRKKEGRAFLGFGLAHYHLGDFPTARWAFAKALEHDPANGEARRLLAEMESVRTNSPSPAPASLFRAGEDSLEIYSDGWKKFFIKGINLGVGLPGYFPGEFAVKEGTYLKWFEQMAELGVNAVRVYTVHPPEFYRALHRFHASGKNRLYLFQGIWTELPAAGDFRGKKFQESFRTELRSAVDAVYGNARLPEQRGKAHGAYEHDVSAWLAAFIVGREWESCAVKAFNERSGRKPTDFRGEFLSITAGTPFEAWIAETCDHLQHYEKQRYGVSHPVTTVSWATLDPLTHPSESTFEDEYRIQGITRREERGACVDIHIEDAETLDLAKIEARDGAGFFALYHAYPYYPDFLNHDYLAEPNTYLAYLRALKRHHGKQPVLIAEFGVPSSRESAHWHRDGWNQGGHNEARQGEVDGLLMQAIYDAGMAGGILFSWFDEWFKKNWLFEPYEHPAERKPLWFNHQDPEENYGLLAMYPSYPDKKSRLAGRDEDWQSAHVLYEKNDDSMACRFPDGADNARRLLRLAAQHDEGFLYLRLDAHGPIDFEKAHYIIGLDTTGAGAGERLLPFRTKLKSPRGLSFLVHLAGRNASRILAARSYDKNGNEKIGAIKPMASEEGAWVMMQSRTNIRRISKDGGKFFPSHVVSMSRLTFGSLEEQHKEHSSLADFYVQGSMLELRIPWGLLNVTDPSSRTVLWKEKGVETKEIKSIGMIAVSYKPESGGVAAKQTGLAHNHADTLPAVFEESFVKAYAWEKWETPLFHSYRKKSYYAYQQKLSRIPERP